MKISFKNDYSEGAHPKILERLIETNTIQTVEGNYGEDRFSENARNLIHQHLQSPKSAIHFVSGGTQANLLVISSILKPYEAVIAADTGHIAVHETGAIEATGHKVLEIGSNQGKINLEALDNIISMHLDEHMVKPKMVYISNATELGTVYNKKELLALRKRCDKYGLILFLDGARLGSALASPMNDLTLKDIAQYTDVFYMGGTKNGALLGEAIIINNPQYQAYFRYQTKQRGALLAKGRLLGIQFETLFTDNLYFDIGASMNQRAKDLAEGILNKGYQLWMPISSNQVFVILNNDKILELSEYFAFIAWEKVNETQTVIRLVTSWATPQKNINAFLKML